MSLFDTIGSLLGKSDGGSTSVPEALLAALGNQEGGLGGLIQKFEIAGLGNTISSWVGTGENQARVARTRCTASWVPISSNRSQPRPACRSSSCCRRSPNICHSLSTA